MKAVRMLFLMVGLICAYTALAAPVVPTPSTARRYRHAQDVGAAKAPEFEFRLPVGGFRNS